MKRILIGEAGKGYWDLTTFKLEGTEYIIVIEMNGIFIQLHKS